MKTTAQLRKGRIDQYDKEDWSAHLFDTKGSMLIETFARVTLVLLWTIALVAFDQLVYKVGVPNTAHMIVGTFLSLLLVFRTNASYDRFWEGRRQWGAINNDARNLARQCSVLLAGDLGLLHRVLQWSIELPPAIMHTLRGTSWTTEKLPADEVEKVRQAAHVPLAVARQITILLDAARAKGVITDVMQMAVDQGLQRIIDSCGACERIHSTPLPFAYVVHLRRALVLYLFTLPFALLPTYGWGTIVVGFLISFILYGIEEIGVEIEDPFGHDANDLPLEVYCHNIEKVLEDLMRTAEQEAQARAKP